MGAEGMLLGLRTGPWGLGGWWRGVLWDLRGESVASMDVELAGSAMGGTLPPGGGLSGCVERDT